MERLISKLLLLAACAIFPLSMDAYSRIVYDKKTTAAVVANTTYEEALEQTHNAYLTRQQKKKKKLAEMAAAMETIKEGYRYSMQNINGFGAETAFYKQIAQECAAFPGNFLRASKLILHNPMFNYINSLNELSDIQLDMIQLVDKFVDIVNNGKIENPLKKHASSMVSAAPESFGNKGDGYNFMDRNQRMDMAVSILAKVKDINDRLYVITILCKYYSDISHVMRSMDPVTWCSFFNGKSIVEKTVRDWNWEINHKI